MPVHERRLAELLDLRPQFRSFFAVDLLHRLRCQVLEIPVDVALNNRLDPHRIDVLDHLFHRQRARRHDHGDAGSGLVQVARVIALRVLGDAGVIVRELLRHANDVNPAASDVGLHLELNRGLLLLR
ncbi:hypothetical protein D9M72_449210 [compost metagenome]